MKYLIILALALTSCLSPLQREIRSSDNSLVEFLYIDNDHILAKAKRAVWLSAGFHGDTISLNPGECVLLNLPDDEFNVEIGSGNVTLEFTF